MDILTKIKNAGLVGRGGACFPTGQKWSAVAKAMADKATLYKKCYVVCNAAEGEPGVKKDKYILENYPERVIDGIQRAMEFLLAQKAFIYLNPHYYRELAPKIKKVIGEADYIELFYKPIGSGYVGGEETSLLNTIEGKRTEPRLRPPFPTTNGLWGCPTLINNVETFYNVSLVVAGEYKGNRFYTVDGDCLWEGVYDLPANYTIERVLKETKNYPEFPFFVQVGGAASGEVLASNQLKKQASGVGSIRIYSLEKHKPYELISKWLEFFSQESCGQCTTCREGTYRLVEAIKKDKPDWGLIKDLLLNLEDSSFCALGSAVPIPVMSYVKNVLPQYKKVDEGKKVLMNI